MPRKLREDEDGAVHHVYARANDRLRLYRDDLDRRLYLAMLGQVVREKRWRCLAYCLMHNHVHLLIETRLANLASGMQLLHGLYAQKHNTRHGHRGHLFQGRYGSVRITSDAQLWTAVAYVVRNPVEAGLCAEPAGWPWSSHRATIAGRPPPWLDVGHLFAYLGAMGGEPRRRYAELTRASTARPV